MNMPFNVNPGKLAPIEVFEDDKNFLVRIHPAKRDRAKKIDSRQWDGERKVWVYRKDPRTYEALVEEFQKDADSFDIQRPMAKSPSEFKQPARDNETFKRRLFSDPKMLEEFVSAWDEIGGSQEKMYREKLEDQLLEEVGSLDETGGSQEKMNVELEQIREMLGSLGDIAKNQSRILEEVLGTQEETTKLLVKLESPAQQKIEIETVEVIPYSLDLTKQREIELLERVLVMIVCGTANDQKSFCEWVKNYQPLRSPSAFVTRTHEFLKEQLGKIVGDENKRTNFNALIERANREKIIYHDPNKPQEEPILILRCLNFHRNYFAHPDHLNQWEEWKRSILYLMHLPLIWSKIVIDEDSNI